MSGRSTVGVRLPRLAYLDPKGEDEARKIDMNILLINPPYLAEERYGKNLARFGPTTEPLGLAYVAATLEKEGYGVKIIDASAKGYNQEDIFRRIREDKYDIIGITMLTPMFKCSIETAKTARQAASGAKIVAGGIHPTVLPLETLKGNPEIDFVIIGEGEITMIELVKVLENNSDINKINGVGFRTNGNIVINNARPLIKDIDNVPLPSRHLLPMECYKMTVSRSRNRRCYTIIVARGCPYRCTYCSHPFGRTFRHHSAERILQEIELLINIYEAGEINFEADTLTINREFLKSLCQGIIQSGFNKRIRWTCQARVDTVDKETLKLMYEAGCWEISYGVESGSQRLLDVIKKDFTLEQVEQAFQLTKDRGISIRAFFMLGLPTETRRESLETINFAKKLDAAWTQFTITTPYPGTELFELAKKDGTLKSFNWEDYRSWGGWTKGELVYIPMGRSCTELKNLQRQALKQFYLRPKIIFRFLRDLESLNNLKRYIAGAWVLLGNLKDGRK